MIALLGIIALGGGLLLVYFIGGYGAKRRSAAEERGAPLKPKDYETSEDGKVVYLFNKNKGGGAGPDEPGNGGEPPDGKHGGGSAGDDK